MELLIMAHERTDLGKNAVRRLRANGRLPGVVYGKRYESRAVDVDPKEILGILHSDSGRNTIFQIQVGEAIDNVLIRDLQIHPVRGTLLHADFQAIEMTEKMDFEVPIEVVGSARGVKQGGILEIVMRHIEVSCLPGDLPDDIPVDVSDLEIGDQVHASDLQFDRTKIEMLTDENRVILTVAAPMAEEPEAEEAVAEEAQPAEPEVIKKGKEEEGED